MGSCARGAAGYVEAGVARAEVAAAAVVLRLTRRARGLGVVAADALERRIVLAGEVLRAAALPGLAAIAEPRTAHGAAVAARLECRIADAGLTGTAEADVAARALFARLAHAGGEVVATTDDDDGHDDTSDGDGDDNGERAGAASVHSCILPYPGALARREDLATLLSEMHVENGAPNAPEQVWHAPPSACRVLAPGAFIAFAPGVVRVRSS